MRIYVPANLAAFTDEVCRTGTLNLAAGTEIVTPLLRDAQTADEAEEAEFVGLYLAADLSAQMVAGDTSPALRVVVSCDVADGSLPAPDETGHIVLSQPLTGAKIACAHVDDVAESEAIAAALQALVANDAALDDHDLLWYDASELADIPGRAH